MAPDFATYAGWPALEGGEGRGGRTDGAAASEMSLSFLLKRLPPPPPREESGA